MAWWPQRKASPPEQQTRLVRDDEAALADKALDAAHAEADRALATVRRQNEEKRSIKEIIEGIRKENHFVDLWRNDGVGA